MRRAALAVLVSLLALTALDLTVARAGAQPNTAAAPPRPKTESVLASSPALWAPAKADLFLTWYNDLYQRLTAVASEAEWAAATDVNDRNAGRRTAAGQMFAAFRGAPSVIAQTRALLAERKVLTPLQIRQLDKVLLNAGSAPGTIPDVVAARIEAESRASAIQDAFTYCLGKRDKAGKCGKPASANDVDEQLHTSKKVAERLAVWTAAKEIGVPLKASLVELQKLRNQVAREMGYSSFFGLQVADYGMTVDEMMALLDGFVRDTRPLFTALHTWTGRELARRYGQPAPTGPVPAHWFPNRWAQEWGGLVTAVDLDPHFEGKQPQWIVEQAERFYVSLGLPALPKSFWARSDLYPVPKGSPRKKNSHASAWHVDIGTDIRSLMSVEANSQWFSTSHHELGHIYYYLAYTRPEVPPVLREGANRAFHEGIGELITVAAGQTPYLQQAGILPPDAKVDPVQHLLAEALEHTVAFLPWAAGVMSRFEYELYEKNLPPAQWQERWWALVEQYQGVAPPDAKRKTDPALCDPCTKTHVIDDPAQYYDYAIATVIKYQLHEHICRKILQQDPHACNYYGSKETGAFLQKILALGATRDWRDVLREATGEDLSTRALVAYFAPLQAWLDAENARAAR